MILLLLLSLFAAFCRSTEPLASIARGLFSEDFFLTHLSSDFVNKSIDPCDNFYRHICPNDFPESSWIWGKLMNQVNSVMNIYSFMDPEPDNHVVERLMASARMDRTNYNDNATVARALKKISAKNLVRCFAKTRFNGLVYYAADRKFGYKNPIRFYDKHIKSVLLDKLLNDPKDIIPTMVPLAIEYSTKLAIKSSDKDFRKLYDNFDIILRDETMLMNFVERLSDDHKNAMKRLDSVIGAVVEEYKTTIDNAPWKSAEDRFGNSRFYIASAYLRNMSYGIAYTERFSIDNNVKINWLEKYEKIFVKNYEDLEMDNRGQCVINFIDTVCDRFTEVTCSSKRTSMEDASDIYGVQIAFKVLQKMLGDDLDKIVFPQLQMTHRELFYNTIPVMYCNTWSTSQWTYYSSPPDSHSGTIYRTNAMIGSLPDFKRTFACYDDDFMVFSKEKMCPAFSEHIA